MKNERALPLAGGRRLPPCGKRGHSPLGGVEGSRQNRKFRALRGAARALPRDPTAFAKAGETFIRARAFPHAVPALSLFPFCLSC